MPERVTRRRDWVERLDAYLSGCRNQPMVWGSHDCVLFSLRAAEAITGLDLTAGISGTYRSAAGAARRMLELYQARDLVAAAEAFRHRWNGEEVSPLMAQRGDIVMAEIGPGGSPALGVVALDGCNGLFIGAEGLQAVPLRSCSQAWRVG